ncbi:preprotein translocase subunit SecE [Granulosicoccus antarcticus]|uniref:Protein translocase subunit SecE n=1 Tax=Granulosicoccus antarcticus IMCC3135 TaxID=1192854 RepID=A0A2Z2NKU6_9GAMM|nr:preprotein translocase subunit SecE [Granulosicoccus antarcticus]ASJ71763.1 Protein translocase subunit SecE [Granulosicoccus antarcticus IMCC3135]
MVSKAEVQTNSADTVKLVAAGALVLLGLVAFYYFAEQSLLLRVVGLLLIGGLAAFIVYQADIGKRIVAFFRDARTEVRKVVWPSRAETTQTTVTVFIIVVLVGIFLWLFDMLLAFLFRAVTGI